MNKYYKLDSRKVTFGEYWNITRSPMVIVPWVAKILKIPMRFAAGMPDFDSVRELEVQEVNFDARAREKLQPLLDKCLTTGFHSPRFFTYANMQGNLRTSFIAMVHETGATLRLMYSLAKNGQIAKEKMLVVLLSELSDRTWFVTSGQRKQFLSAPEIMVNRLVGAGPERLLESHLQKLAEFQYTNPARPARTTEELDDLWDRYEKLGREFGMQRGIYVWMTPEEVAKESQGLAEVKAAIAETSGENAGVMLELHKLQNKKAGWGGILALLVISLLFFIIAGSRQWSWSYVLLLLPILFIHELGHYLAMRAYDYRNLRMFFIPFFGAAVSGQNYNVPGWKKVVVSLMGPVPGIVLGIIIGMAGLVLHQPWMMKLALVALLLNGFNLLPVLPLDGGRVCHTLIFSRHPVLDAAFRVVAAIALMIIGSFTKSKILMYLGIPMLLGIPAAYKTARIAAELKGKLPPVLPAEQNIPAATADAIINELKRSSSKPLADKLLAQQALQIFETINARPPGGAATAGLLFVQAASFGLAVVFAMVFLVAQRRDLRDLFAHAAEMPKHRLMCGPVPHWEGRSFEAGSAVSNLTLIATFARPTLAGKTFQSLTNELPDSMAVKWFGDSLLLSLPPQDDAARKRWLAELEGQTKDVFVDSTNYHAAISLICVAPSKAAAESITSELRGYFETLPGLALVPPWQAPDLRAAPQKARDELARQTYIKLQDSEYGYFTNAELRSLQKDLRTAQKQASQAEVDELEGKIKALGKKLRTERIEAVRSGANGAVDAKVVELFSDLTEKETRTNRAAADQIRQELAQQFGRLKAENLTAGGGQITAQFGSVTQNGLYVNVNWVSFDRVDEGPMALAAWLCDRGCIGLRYDFKPGMGTMGGESNE